MNDIRALTWRGEPVSAVALLERYRMTIEPAPAGPAWRVVEIREAHGRANLHVACLAETPGRVALDWSTVAGLTLPAATDERGIADLPVNAGSYYVPADGPGPHRVSPVGPADRVTGWGLALGLPDGPPPDLDNRYQTLAVTWQWQEAAPIVPGPVERADVIADVARVLEEQAGRLRAVAGG